MEGWVDLVGGPTAESLSTKWSTVNLSIINRRQVGNVRRPQTDVPNTEPGRQPYHPAKEVESFAIHKGPYNSADLRPSLSQTLAVQSCGTARCACLPPARKLPKACEKRGKYKRTAKRIHLTKILNEQRAHISFKFTPEKVLKPRTVLERYWLTGAKL